jgi:hypothetical protein
VVDALPDAKPAPKDGPAAATATTADADPGGGAVAGPAVGLGDAAPENDPDSTEALPPPTSPLTAPVRRTRRYRDDDVSEDDRDLGWGDRPGGSERGDGWYLRERPPHHG